MGSDPEWQQKMVERFLMLEEEKEEKKYLFPTKLDQKDNHFLKLRNPILFRHYQGFLN